MSAISRDLDLLFEKLAEIEARQHMINVLSYDMETAAPKGGMKEDGENMSLLSNENFKAKKDSEYLLLVHRIKQINPKELNAWENRLITLLSREIQKNKNVSQKTAKEIDELFNTAYIEWIHAKEAKSYEAFAPTLSKIINAQKRLVTLRNEYNPNNLYDTLISDYEEGFTTKDLDVFFDTIEQGIVPLLRAVKNATYTPRHDFLTKSVPIHKQEKFSRFLLEFNGFDFNRGSLSTTEHPFTSQLGRDDVRITTKYIEHSFISNMYSIIHEGGHALFGQNIPEEVFSYHIGESSLTMAKHESVSRFYENVIGRSKEYIHAIYPKFQELFSKELGNVTEDQLYEGVNYVDLNNKLRTEADELTYSLHIIIRYRLEKEMMNGKVDCSTLNQRWNEMYKEILGVDVKNDAEGILQDVHWTNGFGYFPTYAMGNALNCIYLKKICSEMDFYKNVRSGKMQDILKWMKKNVFASAPLYDTKDWIKKICGEDFGASAYVEYLTNKFTKIYKISAKDLALAKKQLENESKAKEVVEVVEPVEQKKAPVEQKKAPAEQKKAPAEEKKTPAKKGK